MRNTFLKRSASVVMLLLYLGAVVLTNLHIGDHDHHDEESICTADTDKNPCHLAIYHHDKVNGCHHPGHLQKVKFECKLCYALIFPGVEVQDNRSADHVADPTEYTSATTNQLSADSKDPSRYDRGPPYCTEAHLT